MNAKIRSPGGVCVAVLVWMWSNRGAVLAARNKDAEGSAPMAAIVSVPEWQSVFSQILEQRTRTLDNSPNSRVIIVQK